MLSMPDLATLRLCCMMTSMAYCIVLLVLARDHRDESHWLPWAVSSAIYGLVLIGFELATHVVAVGILYGCLSLSTILMLSGIRRFDGEPAWRPWMAAPVVGTALGFLIPAFLDPEGNSLEWLSRIGGTAGLAASMIIAGGIMIFGRHQTARRGRQMAGLALFGYLPAYAVAMAADWSGRFDPHLAALLPMMSDQILLAILYLGLLSMSGERAHAALREMALRDPLTQALNRAGLMAGCPGDLPRDTGIILIDVDHFKEINDRYGHAIGDAVLVDLVERIGSLLPHEDDVVARLGGDEFVVVLHGTTLDRARGLADRFCMDRKKAHDRISGLPHWAASLGVAMSAGGLADTLAMADRALYAAKASGRSRVVA